MKLSELIEDLQEAQKLLGDVPVHLYVYDEGWHHDELRSYGEKQELSGKVLILSNDIPPG